MNAKRFLCTVAAILVLGWLPAAAQAADAVSGGLKIGIIGSGRIGGTLGELWTRAGHDVMFSSLDLKKDRELAKRVGAKAGTPAQSAAFGEVLPVAVPYAALAQVGRDHAGSIKGKVVLDSCNPNQSRDGEMAVAAPFWRPSREPRDEA